MKPLLCDDDPFLTESPNGHGVYYNFEKFKKCHKMIADAGEIHTIAIIAGEIENHPEMKEYIQGRLSEFNLGIHGWMHERYSEWPKEAIKVSLLRAKEKIRITFGSVFMEYYPTWNQRSDELYKACDEIGLRLDDNWMNLDEALNGGNKRTIRFHSWNDHEVELLKKYLCQE